MTADVLSDVLSAVRLRGAVFYWVEAAAPWMAISPDARQVASMVMPGSDHVMEFHLLVEGECWVGLMDGEPELAQSGDVILYPHGDAHIFRSARDLQMNAAHKPAMPQPSVPMVLRIGPEGAQGARFVCGYLGCDARPFNPLLAALPRMLRVPAKPGGDPISEFVRIAAHETAKPSPGSEAIRARLAEMLFVAVLRRYLVGLPEGAGGWLAGLRDPHVGRALSLLHARPAEAWTLAALARAAGLSRTALHARFTELVGRAPMQYLTQWRMQLAATRLAQGNDKVASIALDVGYESEAAFNRAFKRLAGTPPAAWRRRRGEAGRTPTPVLDPTAMPP